MKISRYLDHTLLKADASEDEIRKLCKEAMIHKFASVCVAPHYVPLCRELITDEQVAVSTVIGFPLGSSTTETKLFESIDAIRKGADELDIVVNISKLIRDDAPYIRRELEMLREATSGVTIKLILETCLLTGTQLMKGCQYAIDAKFDFVKTSTGFSKEGATLPVVRAMKRFCGNDIQIKASGGIRDLQSAVDFLISGAVRIGTSSSISIVRESQIVQKGNN